MWPPTLWGYREEGLAGSCINLVPRSCSPSSPVLEKHAAQGGQSGVHVFILSLSLGRFFVASDVLSCRKTGLCLQNFPVTVTDHSQLQPELQ